MFLVKVLAAVQGDCVDRVSTDGVPLRFIDGAAPCPMRRAACVARRSSVPGGHVTVRAGACANQQRCSRSRVSASTMSLRMSTTMAVL